MPQFYIPPNTDVQIDDIHRVTLQFAAQEQAEEFFHFIVSITTNPGQKPKGRQ